MSPKSVPEEKIRRVYIIGRIKAATGDKSFPRTGFMSQEALVYRKNCLLSNFVAAEKYEPHSASLSDNRHGSADN
jgi:hypothetical protein